MRLEIPYALSYLAYGKFKGKVDGMNTLQAAYEAKYGEGNYIPPVKTTFWTFRIMAGLGGVLVLLSLMGLYFNRRGILKINHGIQKYWLLPYFSHLLQTQLVGLCLKLDVNRGL